MFTRFFLGKIKRKALRNGKWFQRLDDIERRIVNLAIRVVDKVKSILLGVELVKILKKLRKALKSGFVRRMETSGITRAREISVQAIKWGYGVAREWASDYCFIRYVTLLTESRLALKVNH